MSGTFSYTREKIYHVENLAVTIFIELNFRKCKWMLLGTYHPPSQKHDYYFENLSNALNMYISEYDKILLTGDFNTNESHVAMKNFLELFNLTNLVKENTCFKSIDNPSCIDLFITNSTQSFLHTSAITTGVSDFHKMIITVLRFR